MDNKPIITRDSFFYKKDQSSICAYCGADLDKNLYFCLLCATPYKSVEAVLPPIRRRTLSEGEQIIKKVPQVLTLFWTYVAVIFGTNIFCYFLFGKGQFKLTFIFQSFALFVTTCVFADLYWPSLAVQFKHIGLFQKEALFGLLALIPLSAINLLYHGWLIRDLGVKSFPLNQFSHSVLGKPLLILVFCVFPAIIEETAFRGLVQHWLQISTTPFRSLFLASTLFTALHFSILSAPYIFMVGMMLGWVKQKTRSLYPSILIHFLHNLAIIELNSVM